jgi:adenylate kinase
MNFVILGPPGSGKGTQAKRVTEELGIAHLSTGDVLRDAVKKGTELGKKAEGFMQAGELVPDTVMVGIIEDKIASGELSKGFMLDGFPRTIPQAESLKAMLDKNQIRLDKAILLDVSDDEIVKRLSGRFFCPTCQTTYNYPANMPINDQVCDHDGAKLQRRPDDEEDVVRNRLSVYKKQTQPIEDFYRKESILTAVQAEDTPENVFRKVLQAAK